MKIKEAKRKIEIFSIIFNKESINFQKKINELNLQIIIIEKNINLSVEIKNKNKFYVNNNIKQMSSLLIYEEAQLNITELEKKIKEDIEILMIKKEELEKIKKEYLLFFKKINIYKNYYNKIIKNEQIKLDKKLEQEINDFFAHREKNYYN